MHLIFCESTEIFIIEAKFFSMILTAEYFDIIWSLFVMIYSKLNARFYLCLQVDFVGNYAGIHSPIFNGVQTQKKKIKNPAIQKQGEQKISSSMSVYLPFILSTLVSALSDKFFY